MRYRFLVSAFCMSALAAAPPVRELNVSVRMRDGVNLSANVFRPAGARRYPTVLVRTPYGKGGDLTPNYQSFVNRGYAVVVQDVRGRYASEGNFDPINQEVHDGDDTLNWIARQAWSDGGVGMYGGSYLGIVQWKAALSRNPHLKAIFPYVSGDDDYRDRFYSPGGAMKFGHRLSWVEENMRMPDYEPPPFYKYIWELPTRLADSLAAGRSVYLWQTIARHPAYDKFWKDSSIRERIKSVHVPVYSVGGWYDNYAESDLDAFMLLQKNHVPSRVMIGPWPHTFGTPFKDVSFGKESIVPLRREQIAWFDHWLKGLDFAGDQPPVRIFVMGLNKWRDEQEWPLARAADLKLYLNSGGGLGDMPASQTPPDSFVYDPKNPVPTTGGAVCCNNSIFPWGPLDQRPVETRHDVLVYSTPPLTADMEVTGSIRMILYAASSAVDTDFTAKLVDVFPSGEARILCDGILRTRYRESLEKPKLMNAGETYRLTIDLGVTSNLFRVGHRVRLEVSSSNFPKYDRNLNSGGAVADEKVLRKAAQTVFHDRERHSYLLLPVVPPATTELTSTHQPRYVPKRPTGAAR